MQKHQVLAFLSALQCWAKLSLTLFSRCLNIEVKLAMSIKYRKQLFLTTFPAARLK